MDGSGRSWLGCLGEVGFGIGVFVLMDTWVFLEGRLGDCCVDCRLPFLLVSNGSGGACDGIECVSASTAFFA